MNKMPDGEMMTEVVMLGNGFDLHHLLPTRYIDFLATVWFLKKNKDKNYQTVGEIFGSKELQTKDPSIKTSYLKYKTAYDKTVFAREDQDRMISLLESNCWISYFEQALNKDINWIDFESEIAKVLQCFHYFFSCGKNEKLGIRPTETEEYAHLTPLLKFPDLFTSFTVSKINVISLKSDYFCQDRNPELRLTDEKRISEYLFDNLVNLSVIMKLFFSSFVDRPFEATEKDENDQIFELKNATYVISFNYTKTYESAYCRCDHTWPGVFHIHGKAEQDIVLGINAGEEDNIETMDPVFLSFKKYYQRISYDTDNDFLNMLAVLKDAKKEGKKIILKVYGHSLDVTDCDIITEMFEIADKIYVFSHDQQSRNGHIKNVIRLFGKDGMNRLRTKHDLKFIVVTSK